MRFGQWARLLLLLALPMLAVACGGDGNEEDVVRDAVREGIAAFNDNDFDKLSEILTENFYGFEPTAEALEGTIGPSDSTIEDLEFISVTVDGDEATAEITFTVEGMAEQDTILLVKVAGRWLWDRVEFAGDEGLEEEPGDAPPVPAGPWSATGSMAEGRMFHTATLLADGRVLVVGGIGEETPGLRSAEIYDPVTEVWLNVARMAQARSDHTATLLPDGRVLVTGGAAPLDVRGPANGEGIQATPLSPSGSAEIYDPGSDRWTDAGQMSEPRFSHTATPLGDGRVLVVGGIEAELYDPLSGDWSAAGSLTEFRAMHTATLLSDGRVLVVGGGDGRLAEAYDPATNSWSAAGETAEARMRHTATLLSDGRVLVVGGESGSEDIASVEIYDPTTGSWSDGGRTLLSRSRHTATPLPDGRVLVAGGVDVGSAEVLDPATGTWADGGNLIRSRYSHTATLLSDGRILLAGGVSPEEDAATTATAEVCEALVVAD